MQPAPAPSGHPDLPRILADFRTNEDAARQLTHPLSDEQLNWQPHNGEAWSILQCLEHLTLTNAAYTGAMRRAAAEQTAVPPQTGPIQPSVLGGQFVKRLEPPVTKRVRAPKVLLPSSDRKKEDVLSALIRSHEQIFAVIKETSDRSLNRLRFRNPMLPLLRVRFGTALLIMAAHERRHLWQAKQVAEAVTAR